MSGLNEIGPSDHFSAGKYQRRYTNKTLSVQAALGVIVLSGITLAVLSHYGCIDRVFVYPLTPKNPAIHGRDVRRRIRPECFAVQCTA